MGGFCLEETSETKGKSQSGSPAGISERHLLEFGKKGTKLKMGSAHEKGRKRSVSDAALSCWQLCSEKRNRVNK